MIDLRQLIVSVVGHVDHGKSSILDKVRCSNIIDTEAGKITQAIGASCVPMDSISKICGSLLKIDTVKIPGLLFIDTPGHAAFTSLRRRGGSLADMAILVVDINEGFKPQTKEALEILKQFKTPFIVAANKLDLLPGWQPNEKFFIPNLKSQTQSLQTTLDTKIYELVGKLHELGFQSERLDRVEDFAKQIAIVPCSAKTGEGIPEILMGLIGMAQKFMGDSLELNTKEPAKGVVLEVKEAKGLGKVLDTIIYSGTIKRNDQIIIGGVDDVIKTKVKLLQVPLPLCEIRDKKTNFKLTPEVKAAASVRISAPNIDKVIAGMPVIVVNPENQSQAEEELKKQIDEVIIQTDQQGIVIKADSLGSLEALVKMLQEREISIKSATIGNISKKDIIEAEANFENDPLDCVILGFNTKIQKDVEDLAKEKKVKVISSEVIYSIIDEYEKYKEESKKQFQKDKLELLITPAKMRQMPGYVFRQCNPAIVGVEIISGSLKLNSPVMNKTGKTLSHVRTMQEDQDNVKTAEAGKQVAISLDHITIGRQMNEGDILYSAIPEEDFKKFKELKDLLKPEQKELLKEIAEIMRKANPFWGI
jgi:translation initiation factor 5B